MTSLDKDEKRLNHFVDLTKVEGSNAFISKLMFAEDCRLFFVVESLEEIAFFNCDATQNFSTSATLNVKLTRQLTNKFENE